MYLLSNTPGSEINTVPLKCNVALTNSIAKHHSPPTCNFSCAITSINYTLECSAISLFKWSLYAISDFPCNHSYSLAHVVTELLASFLQ